MNSNHPNGEVLAAILQALVAPPPQTKGAAQSAPVAADPRTLATMNELTQTLVNLLDHQERSAEQVLEIEFERSRTGRIEMLRIRRVDPPKPLPKLGAAS